MPSALDEAPHPDRAHDARHSRLAIVRAFLRFLDDASVDWVVLGRGLEGAVEGQGDLDLVVEPSQVAELPQLVGRFCETEGVGCARVLQHEWNAFNFALAWRDTASRRLEVLQLDLCGDYGRSARRFLTAAELLGQRRRSAAAPHPFVPAAELAFIAHLLKKVDKEELSPAAFEYLCARWQESPSASLVQLLRFFDEGNADRVRSAIALRDLHALRAALPGLRAALYRRVRRAPRDWLREATRLARRAVHPAGYWVAVLGPDGAGKSTLIEHIADELRPLFRSVQRYHLRPHLLDAPRDLSPVVTPHAVPPRGRVASFAKLCLWWLDCTAGYLLDLYPRLARGQLVLFDRHFLDLLVDSRRYRYGGSQPLASLFCASTFLPALFVLLDAPVDVIRSRKREVARPELERQRGAYLELLSGLASAVVVDASRGVDEVARDVVDSIVTRLERRCAARLEIAPPGRAPERNESTEWTPQ